MAIFRRLALFILLLLPVIPLPVAAADPSTLPGFAPFGASVSMAIVSGMAPVSLHMPTRPTPEPTPTEETTGATVLASFLPSRQAIAASNLATYRTDYIETFEQTTIHGLHGSPYEDAWVTGILAYYAPLPELKGVIQGQIELEQFDSASTTASLFALIDANMSSQLTPLEPPSGTSADRIDAFLIPNETPEGFGLVVINGYYGDVVVSTGAIYPPGSDPANAEVTARNLWLAVDATRAGGYRHIMSHEGGHS